MANYPQSSLSVGDGSFRGGRGGGGGGGGMSSSSSRSRERANKDRKIQSAERLVLNLHNPNLRENALLELSKEIVSLYPVLSPPNLTPAQSNRVCNVLALLQEDPMRSWLQQLLHNVDGDQVALQAGGFDQNAVN